MSSQPIALPVHTPPTASPVDSTAARKEHLEAKRAFDRVKQHPVVNDDEKEGTTVEYKAADGSIKTMTQVRVCLGKGGEGRASSTLSRRWGCVALSLATDAPLLMVLTPSSSTPSGPSPYHTQQAELHQRLQQQEAVLPQLSKDGSALSKSEEGKATLEEVRVCVFGLIEGWE